MNTPTTAWDRAPTDKELASFYGTTPDRFEVATAIERQAAALDADDLCQVAQEFASDILEAVRNVNAGYLFHIFTRELKATVARRASMEIYQDVSVVKPSAVSLGVAA